jgi:hypothetical protein
VFNTAEVRQSDEWPALAAVIAANPEARWVSSEPPPVGAERWALRLGVDDFANGELLGERIAELLSGTGRGPTPATVIVDELRGGRNTTLERVAACAQWLRREHPALDGGRWAVYLAHQDVEPFNAMLPAIDPLLAAGATIAVEMYATERAYCAAARGDPERGDAWLADFFLGGRGASPRPGFAWLAERRRELGSRSRLTAVFGVTDDYLDGHDPFTFLDRMFFVWMTRTGYPGIIGAANGGAGSYKWQRDHLDSATRDQRFAESWDHYCRQGLHASLAGRVACG